MLNQNWDLYILSPLFILLGLAVVTKVIFRERLSFKWIAFAIETIFIWIAIGMTTTWNASQLGWQKFGTPVQIALFFFGSNLLFLTILKPLATFLTGRIHHRRWWIYGSAFFLFLAIILTYSNNHASSIATFVFVGIFLAAAFSANSLYFLFENEQFYYRIAPNISTVVVATFILFGTFVGSYITQIEIVTSKQTTNYHHVLLFVLSLLALCIAAILMTINGENPEFVRGFDGKFLPLLPQFNLKVLFYLMGSALLVSLIFSTSQSTLIVEFLRTKLLLQKNYNHDIVMPWIRTFKTFAIVPQFLLGYLLYKVFIEKFEYRITVSTNLVVMFASFAIMAFSNYAYVSIFFNFLLGLAASQLFYAFFAMAIMWNYRAKGIPVTGLVAAMQAFGQFVLTQL